MRKRVAVLLFAALVPPPSLVGAQPALPTRPGAAPAQGPDLSAARRMAAELAEVRAILNDPNADVRMLAMREIALRGSAVQRQVAIEAGLSSPDAAMQELAVRLLLAGIPNIILPFVSEDGQPFQPQSAQQPTAMNLQITAFDVETGRFRGPSPGGCNSGETVGQISGTAMTFISPQSSCSGSLRWNADSREFRGVVNLQFGQAWANRQVVWRPQ